MTVLLFDGTCDFCRAWVGFWRGVTGESVEYLAFAESRERFPDIEEEEARKASILVTDEGRFSGAAAICRMLGGVPGYSWIHWMYRHVPGFAGIAAFLYRWIAGHRNAAMRMTRLLWGSSPQRPTYHTAAALFSRALTFVYFVAFFSFALQARGLLGSEGIVPVGRFLSAVRTAVGASGMWRLPTLFWWGSSDFTLLSIAWGGVALSLVCLLAKPHSKWQRIIFIVLWVYYLSIVNAGQTFMAFQWDWLLLEAGFLAIFLKPARPRVWLFQWLLLRLVLESGVVKLASGDASWHNLTALTFHYETQPLPTPLAWYFHQLPLWFHKASAVVMFVIELGMPLLILLPRRPKQLAGFAIAGLQVLILLTGNYTFFNLLAIALCLFLFDDAFFARWQTPAVLLPTARVNRVLSWGLAILILVMSVVRIPAIAQFGIVNPYGLFAVMTTTRSEIQIEGSTDGEHWKPYLFRYKPGPTGRRPAWVAPYQPRLDWQMWFAALGGVRQNPWFPQVMLQLLRGSKPVLGLFGGDPFDGTPPKFVRATMYQYHFTTWDEKSKTGNWWKGEIKGLYFPPVALGPQK